MLSLFLLVFLLSDIAHSFHVDLEEVTLAILLTRPVRPVGALIFGRAAEKFGRKPILMLNIVFFSAFELLSAAAPSSMLFFLLRVLYGVAMGGISGVASSLAMETIPDRSRGLMSGLFRRDTPSAICWRPSPMGCCLNNSAGAGCLSLAPRRCCCCRLSISASRSLRFGRRPGRDKRVRPCRRYCVATGSCACTWWC